MVSQDVFTGELTKIARKGRVLAWVFQRGVSSPEDAEDLSQDTLLKGLQCLDTFRGQCSLYTWLISIAKNLVIDYHRKRKKDPLCNYVGPDELSSVVAEGAKDRSVDDPSSTMKELYQKVKSAIDKLEDVSPKRYAVAYLVYRKGFENKEAAECLGVPEGTIKSRLHRARQFIRAEV